MIRYLSFLMLMVFPSALHARQITITAPATNAVVPVGQLCTIAWTSSLAPGTQLRIDVKVIGLNNAPPVASFVPVEAGQYQWLVPWGCLTGTNCTVQISVPEVAFCQGPPFSLVTNLQPALLLHAPAGGEQWPLGATCTVSWEPHNLAGTLTLNLLQGSNVVDTVSGVPVISNRFPYTLPLELPAGSNYTVQLISDAAPSVAAVSLPFSVTRQVPAPRKWTMLFYFDAATSNQETDSIGSVLDLGMLPASTNINYVCQLARSPDYAVTNYPWWGVKRFVMQPQMTPALSNAVQDLGNVSMADPNTLADFIDWAVEQYPAENYFLVLLDHGSGWAGGLLEDEVNGFRWMSTLQLQQALEAAEAPMTMLGLDMCEEADIEIAYQIRHSGPQVFMASQFQESRYWPYLAVFQQLQDRIDDTSVEGLATLLCKTYVASFSDPTDTATLAAIRLGQLDTLTATMAGFADTLTTNSSDQTTVRQQADTVAAAFNDTVIYSARTKMLQQQVYGLNIYFPIAPNPSLTNTYGPPYVDFPPASHWATFLTAYAQNLTAPWISQARASLPEGDPLDLYRFCQAISPATNAVRLTLMAVGPGSIVPSCNGYLLFTNGQTLDIQGIPNDPQLSVTNYFVRWVTDGNAIIATNTAAETTLQLTGDALLIGYFATNKNSYIVNFVTEGNGSLALTNNFSPGGPGSAGTNSLTQVVTAGSDCVPLAALPNPGYAFAGWGGDYAAAANPLTITNVQMDTTVIAYFWPAPPTISFQRAGSLLNLTWPAAPCYVLESSGNISSGSWTPVPGVTTNSVTLPISGTNQFFRLRYDSSQSQASWRVNVR